MIRRLLLSFLVTASLAGCAKDGPTTPPRSTAVLPAAEDSALFSNPPTAFSRNLEGSWSNKRSTWEVGWEVVFAQSGAWCSGSQYGSWQAVMDLRVFSGGEKVWVDVTPAPFPGNAIRFCGTLSGDSCVGWERTYYFDSGGEFLRNRVMSTYARTYYRQR